MAQLLLLVHRIPFPPNKGDKLRSYHLLRHLQQRHRVFLGCFVDDAADWAELPPLRALCPDLIAVPLHRRRASLRSLRSLMHGEPLTQGYYCDRALQTWVDEVVQRERIDASVVFCSSMAQYAPRGVPQLMDFVDLDSAKWGEYAAQRRPPMSWVYRRESRRLLQLERRVAAQAAGSFFATQREVDDFEAAAPECRGRAQVLRNGVDTAHYAPLPERANPFASDEWPLVFTGSMNYWPNVEAVAWFAREVLPRLRQQHPRLRLHVVGREPSPEVRALAGPAVTVTGSVPDVRPYLQHAAAVVAPMRQARGIQNKILEAMAMGQVVVASPVCANAVGASAAQGLLQADDATAFASTLSHLLAEPAGQRRALGEQARRYVQHHCRWDSGFEPLDRCLEGLGLQGVSS